MGFIHGVNRHEAILFPERLDDYIAAENPVRFLDAFVDRLDLTTLGFQRATPAATGRPAYDPADLVKLYIYGYLYRLRSSRRLEQETHRNVELMWLLKKLRPDHKTSADFRKNNLGPLRQVCREFTVLCKQLDLFAGALVAIDGSKFKAVNAKERNFTPDKLAKLLQQIDQHVEGYLQELDGQDHQDEAGTPGGAVADNLQAKIDALQQRKRFYTDLQAQLEASGATQLSLTDPESRAMKLGKGRGTEVCYNVQTAVDSKHKLMIANDVTNDPGDRDWLSPMVLQAKDILGSPFEAVADVGYYHGEEVKTCLEAGITPYVARPITSANAKLGLFSKDDFRYDQATDTYQCPASARLTFRFDAVEYGRHIRYYATSACGGCALKPQCTRSQGGRRITRWVDEHLLEAMEQRVRRRPEVMKQRKQLVEHPFGTMKRWWDAGYFLMRGLEKVRTEFSLTVLAYNLRRVLNLVEMPRLLAALG
jgi:transposase